MADVKISDLLDGDSQITGAQGRVDVPVTIGATTYQVDEGVLNQIPSALVDVTASCVPFLDSDSSLMNGNSDLTFISDTLDPGVGSALDILAAVGPGRIILRGATDANVYVMGDTGRCIVGITGRTSSSVALYPTPPGNADVSNALGVGGILYNEFYAGRQLGKWQRDHGVQRYALAAAPWSKQLFQWWHNDGGVGLTLGSAAYVYTGTNAGAPAPTMTNRYTTLKRGTYSSLVTTTNQDVGLQYNTASDKCFFLYNSSIFAGGFWAMFRFGLETWTTGNRLFIGFGSSSQMVDTDPSAKVDMLGFGIDAADSAISFMHNDSSGTATKETIANQPALASGNGYAGYIHASIDDGLIYWRLDKINGAPNDTFCDGLTTVGGISTDVPAAGILLGVNCKIGNAANVGLGAANLGLIHIYVESEA